METILCGVDLGGSKLSVGLVAESGRVLHFETVHDHVNLTPDAIIDKILGMITDQCRRFDLEVKNLGGIGVGTAGHYRHRDGVMITMSNLKGFKDYPLLAKLRAKVPVPVFIDNDANAQAWAEYKFGSARGLDPFVFLTLSTQIGAGIILGGKLFLGQTGTAGEFGHTIIEPHSEEVCPCGHKGHLIAHASGVAIPSAFRRQLQAGKRSPMAEAHPDRIAKADGPFILEGLARNDEACQGVVEEFAFYLGIGVYNLFQTFNPAAVVLGGGLSHWGDALFNPIEKQFKSLAGDMLFDEMKVLPGKVENSGLVGAALLALA